MYLQKIVKRALNVILLWTVTVKRTTLSVIHYHTVIVRGIDLNFANTTKFLKLGVFSLDKILSE